MNIRRTQWGVGGACNGKQTHTHSVTCHTQEAWILGQGSDAVLTHVSMAHPLIIFMGCEHREHAVGGGGCRQGQTYTHTHSVPRHTQGGWSLVQGSNAILTHVSVVAPNN